ncbi:hypothetical protein SLA2020_273610 [Shorea laevis]
MDDQNEMFSSIRVYEIGHQRPTDDDSNPNHAESKEGDEDNDDGDVNPILGPKLDGDGESDAHVISNEDDDDGVDLIIDEGAGILEIVTKSDDDKDYIELVESFSSVDEDFMVNVLVIVSSGIVQYFTEPSSNMVVLEKRGYGIYFGLKKGYNIT